VIAQGNILTRSENRYLEYAHYILHGRYDRSEMGVPAYYQRFSARE